MTTIKCHIHLWNVEIMRNILAYQEPNRLLGILIDKNLNRKAHIDLNALRISKTIGLIAKVRHPFLLLSSYISLLFSPSSPMGLARGVNASVTVNIG